MINMPVCVLPKIKKKSENIVNATSSGCDYNINEGVLTKKGLMIKKDVFFSLFNTVNAHSNGIIIAVLERKHFSLYLL